jgi:hypothetical protein
MTDHEISPPSPDMDKILSFVDHVASEEEVKQTSKGDLDNQVLSMQLLQDQAWNKVLDEVIPERIQIWDQTLSLLAEQPYEINWDSDVQWKLRATQTSTGGYPVKVDTVFTANLDPEAIVGNFLHRSWLFTRLESKSYEDTEEFARAIGDPDSVIGVKIEKHRKKRDISIPDLSVALHTIVMNNITGLNFQATMSAELDYVGSGEPLVVGSVTNPCIGRSHELDPESAFHQLEVKILTTFQ